MIRSFQKSLDDIGGALYLCILPLVLFLILSLAIFLNLSLGFLYILALALLLLLLLPLLMSFKPKGILDSILNLC